MLVIFHTRIIIYQVLSAILLPWQLVIRLGRKYKVHFCKPSCFPSKWWWFPPSLVCHTGVFSVVMQRCVTTLKTAV